MKAWQRAILYTAIALAILLCIGIFGGVLRLGSFVLSWFDVRDVEQEMLNYPLQGEIDSLDIDLRFSELTVKIGDSFRLESNLKNLSVGLRDGVLTITEKGGSWKRFLGYSVAASTVLYLPSEHLFEQISLRSGAGRLQIEALSAERLELEFGAGEVAIDSLAAKRSAVISTGAGRTVIRNALLTDPEITVGVGALTIVGRTVGKGSIDLGVGAADLTLLGGIDAYTLNIRKGIGEILVDGRSASDGDTFGSGENRIDVEGGIGRIEITFEAASSEAVDTETESGAASPPADTSGSETAAD